ncbi:MAG: hypothetical protein QW767_01095 [Thermoprotei archaeon]
MNSLAKQALKAFARAARRRLVQTVGAWPANNSRRSSFGVQKALNISGLPKPEFGGLALYFGDEDDLDDDVDDDLDDELDDDLLDEDTENTTDDEPDE